MVSLDSSVKMFLTMFISLICLLVSTVSAKSHCEVPETVTNLKAENVTGTSTHLTWDPPSSTKCADHYKITYCSYLYDEVHECAIKTAILPLNTTQYDVTGLKTCRYNPVQVYVVGTDGKESHTEMLLNTGSGEPPKVDKVDLEYVGAVNISLYWDLPRGYRAECYPGFRVCYSAKGDRQETCVDTIEQEFSTSSVAPLLPCTEYKLSVVTVDGNFVADSKTSDKTYVSVVTAPQMPNVTMDVHNQTVHATWQAPDALSLTCATSYLVKNCRLTTDIYPVNCKTVSSETLPLNATEATVSGLDSCTNNHVSVNMVGHNGQSSGQEVVVLDQYTEIPTPTDVTVWQVTTSEFTVSYDKGLNDCINMYRACLVTEGEKENCFHTKRSYTTTFRNLDLKPCSNYTLHFCAIGKNGTASKNFTTTFMTGPASPVHEPVEASPHSALVSWKAVPSAQQCGTHYNVTWQKYPGGGLARSAALPLNATSYNITDLTDCAQYQLTLSTAGYNGTSSGMTQSLFSTPLGDVGPITKFDFFYVIDTLYGIIDFPGDTLDCLNTAVTCWYETGGSNAQEQCGRGKLYWDDGSLKSCVNYTFVVTANMTDHKTTSGSTTFKTRPAKVANLTVKENATAQSVNLTWDNPPTNHLCAEYIQVTTTRVEDGKTTQVKLLSDVTTTTVADLDLCTTYLFEVKPVQSGVDSESDYVVRYTTSCGDSTLPS